MITEEALIALQRLIITPHLLSYIFQKNERNELWFAAAKQLGSLTFMFGAPTNVDSCKWSLRRYRTGTRYLYKYVERNVTR
jgi:hypothetical protein